MKYAAPYSFRNVHMYISPFQRKGHMLICCLFLGEMLSAIKSNTGVTVTSLFMYGKGGLAK